MEAIARENEEGLQKGEQELVDKESERLQPDAQVSAEYDLGDHTQLAISKEFSEREELVGGKLTVKVKPQRALTRVGMTSDSTLGKIEPATFDHNPGRTPYEEVRMEKVSLMGSETVFSEGIKSNRYGSSNKPRNQMSTKN